VRQVFAIENYHRLAKSELETDLGKKFSNKTLKRFLKETKIKNIVAATNE